ncbi:MAG: aspartate kinase, partial [Firmicutes bacterium]|nr:aspartate kinase [Bacillota bacterium]
MVIMKFGGSSIADGERMLNVLEIVKKQKDKKIVVLSACQNITDKLENIAVFAKNKSRKDTQKMIDEVSSYHIDIINATIKNKKNIQAATKLINGYISELSNLIDGISLLNELTPAVMDSVFSFGELLST